jgi:hypothetical protein
VADGTWWNTGGDEARAALDGGAVAASFNNIRQLPSTSPLTPAFDLRPSSLPATRKSEVFVGCMVSYSFGRTGLARVTERAVAGAGLVSFASLLCLGCVCCSARISIPLLCALLVLRSAVLALREADIKRRAR